MAYVVLLPFVFLGGCAASFEPILNWKMEHSRPCPFQDINRALFPVLVRNFDAKYAVVALKDVPAGDMLVTNGFNEDEINRDLRACIGDKGSHKYFEVFGGSMNETYVSVHLPTLRPFDIKGWYKIKDGKIIPKALRLYDPRSLLFGVAPWTSLSGILAVFVYRYLFRNWIGGR